MIRWREVLYLDESMKDEKRFQKAVECAEAKKCPLLPVYGIFLAQNPNNLLEIISFQELLQAGYRNRTFYCVGMAGNRKNAMELVRIILEETWHARGDVRVREYLYPDSREEGKRCM